MTVSYAQPILPTRESTVSMQTLRGLVDVVEQAGVSKQQFLRAARIEPAMLESVDGRIQRSQIYQLCELGMELTGDEALGLHWSARLVASAFNPISDLISHAPTLRDGLESLSKYHPLITDHSSFAIEENNDTVTVRCAGYLGESLKVKRFAAEMLLQGFYRQLRAFSPRAQPRRISFDYPAPSYRAEYERMFEGEVIFDEPFLGLVFDRSLMDAKSPYKDEDMFDTVRAVAERRFLRLTRRTSYATRVRDHLMQTINRNVDMKDVAHSLGLSVRSLRRRLSAEGVTYGDVANDALASVAKQLLRDKQCTIHETAYAMGFSDTSAFHRAFKRWTGTTPHAFRELESEHCKYR
ncbi:MAG: AraC family transcriptional regulator [Steroidobacteraceae bacterium]